MKMPPVHDSVVNVTPLVDIVMCLIIFYMLVAKIGVSTGAEAMDIPESLIGTSIGDMGNCVLLNVRHPDVDADKIYLGEAGPGKWPRVTVLGQDVPLEKYDADGKGTGVYPLRELLTMYKKQNPDFKVIIRAEKELHYQYLEPILITCAEAGAKNVDFNTRPSMQTVVAQ